MKKKLPFILVPIVLVFGALLSTFQVQSATITKGYTFTTNETVTSSKLHTLVDSATLSAITSSDITDGTIALGDMGANSVDAGKIVDASITTSDILSRTILGSNIATNGIDEINLTTNLYFRAGFMSFSNVVIAANSISNSAVQGVTTSAGSADSGKIVKLNASGLVDTTMLSGGAYLLYEDQKASGTSGGTASTSSWTKHDLNTEVADASGLGSIASSVVTLAAGTYRVEAFAQFYAAGLGKIRVRNTTDGTTVAIGGSTSPNNPSNVGSTSIANGRFTIAGSKNFELQYYVSTSAGTSDLGQAVSSGEVEVYASVKFIKE